VSGVLQAQCYHIATPTPLLDTMDISRYLKEGIEATDVSLGDATVVPKSTVKVDVAYQQLISVSNEIHMAVEKRFKGKSTLYGTPNFKDIVCMCLSTDGYKICSSNLKDLSDDDVTLAWQFIDTMSVSSTEGCRELIKRGKSSRSSVGFSRSNLKVQRPVARAIRGRFGVPIASRPVLVSKDIDRATEHYTVEEAVADDCMRWILSSNDAVRCTRELCEVIPKGGKGI